MKTVAFEQNSVAQQVHTLENLSGEEDRKKLRRIKHILKSDEVNRLCKDICNDKGFSDILARDLKQIVQNELCEPEDVCELLEYIKENGGVFEVSDFFFGSASSLLDADLFCKETLKFRDALAHILPRMVKWSGKSGGKTDDGDGERALAVLIKSAYKLQGDTPGDIGIADLDTCEQEVKGKTSRLSDNSNASVSSVKGALKKYLMGQGFAVSDKDFKKDGQYAWNFNKVGLSRLNDNAPSMGLDVADIIRVVLKSGFTRFDDDMIESFLTEEVNNNQIVNITRFLRKFGKLEFAHYTIGNKFEKIIFINPDNLNFKIIEDSDHFYSELENGTIHQGCSLNWATGRDFSQQYTLK